jgi:hypothetical protein
VVQETKKPAEPIWVRPKPGAEMVGCGLTKFYQLMDSGKIRNIRVDGMRLASVESIKQLGTAE